MPALDFHRRFRPLTATPFAAREVPPCKPLLPYVRCFWQKPLTSSPLVIPDACADIIISPDEQRLRMAFCSLDTEPYASRGTSPELFGIRFYFWALPCFVRGSAFDEEAFADLRPCLEHSDFLQADFPRRQAIIEEYLIRRLDKAVQPPLHLNAIDYLLAHCGHAAMADLAMHTAVSPRTLERQFRRALGVTPKEMADIVRYQTLWHRMIVQPSFNILDQVEALGFYDQSHLLNTFRHYHGLSLREALTLAHPVAFFQDRERESCYADSILLSRRDPL